MSVLCAVLILCSPVALAVLCSFLDFFRVTAFQRLVLALYLVLFFSIVSATRQKKAKIDTMLYLAGSTEDSESAQARTAGLTEVEARPRRHTPKSSSTAPRAAGNSTEAKDGGRTPHIPSRLAIPTEDSLRRPHALKDTTNTKGKTTIPKSLLSPTASQVSDKCEKGIGSLSEDEVVVAVMGVTGAGKSSFIQKATGNKEILIGHSLESTTSTVQCYRFRHRKTNFVLVDTPGFNDTKDSDEVIMTRILEWLETSFRRGTKLNGIVYLHRIIDTRMQGSALANLRMFRRLCGPGSFQNVVLATTFWNGVTQLTGEARERELRENANFWARMVEKGSEVVRLGQDRDSALGVLMRFEKRQKVTLQAQHEIVEQGRSVAQTAEAELVVLQREMEEELRIEREKAADELSLLQLERKTALKEEGERFEQERQKRREREEREEAESLAEFIREQERALRKERLRFELEESERKCRERKELARREAEARALALKIFCREAERKRIQEQQEQEDARIARRLQDNMEEYRRQLREHQEARESYYRSYVCQQTSVANRSCNKCSRSLWRKGHQYYYHCCHCRGNNYRLLGGDNYNQCAACGGRCPGAEHPYMTLREAQSDCVIM